MRGQDYFQQGSRGWLRLHEKGGKRHDVPVHHRAAEALDAYLEAAGLKDGRGALFQSVDRAGADIDRAGVDAAGGPGHDQAAGGRHHQRVVTRSGRRGSPRAAGQPTARDAVYGNLRRISRQPGPVGCCGVEASCSCRSPAANLRLLPRHVVGVGTPRSLQALGPGRCYAPLRRLRDMWSSLARSSCQFLDDGHFTAPAEHPPIPTTVGTSASGC